MVEIGVFTLPFGSRIVIGSAHFIGLIRQLIPHFRTSVAAQKCIDTPRPEGPKVI